MNMISLSDDEKQVYEHVKDYLDSKPFFMLEEIIDFLTHRMSASDFTRLKITNLIRALIKKKIIFPGTKLTREDILDVPTRVEIYDYITAMPGTNINEVIKNLELGTNQAVWHLKWLEKFGFLRSAKMSNQKIYFKLDFDETYDEMFFYLRNVKVKKIIKALKDQSESLKPTELSDKLDMHYNTVRKYIGILKRYNLLMEIDVEHKKEYLLNPEMLRFVQEVIDNLKYYA